MYKSLQPHQITFQDFNQSCGMELSLKTAKEVRSLIYRLLCAVKRNLKFVDAYLAKDGILSQKDLINLETIRKLYAQQKEMFDKHTHRADDRIVSISLPYIRPVVQGKAKAPVEFGAKYNAIRSKQQSSIIN